MALADYLYSRGTYMDGKYSKKPILMTNFQKQEKGFSLIEVLISLVVLSVILIGIMIGNAVIQKSSEAAFQRTRAMQDANQVMEQIRKTSRTGSFPSNVTAAYPNNGTVSGFSSLSNESVRVSYVSTTTNPLDVTVTVSWRENGTRNVSTTLNALVTQR